MSSLTKLSMVVCAAACLLLAPGLRAQTPPPGVPEPQAPESRIPAPETPGAQAPGTQVPEIQAPEAQAPEIQAPPGQPPAVAPLASRLGVRVELEPQAIDLLKAMSHRLASARTMTFTAVATYESMARTGEPLAYTTISEVALKRPNMLRVITPGDGPPSEFYYNGRTITAFSPQANLVAVADAPATIDAMLKSVFEMAALYFPFTDVIVADPYGDIASALKIAFVVGQSRVVGDTRTDIIAVATDSLQAQIWIGTADKLPRMIRATFFDDPAHYRHTVMFSNWRLDGPIPAEHFASVQAARATRIPFRSPEAGPPQPATPEGARP